MVKGTEMNPEVVNFGKWLRVGQSLNAKVSLLCKLFVKSPKFLKTYLKIFRILVNHPSELVLEEPFKVSKLCYNLFLFVFYFIIPFYSNLRSLC